MPYVEMVCPSIGKFGSEKLLWFHIKIKLYF